MTRLLSIVVLLLVLAVALGRRDHPEKDERPHGAGGRHKGPGRGKRPGRPGGKRPHRPRGGPRDGPGLAAAGEREGQFVAKEEHDCATPFKFAVKGVDCDRAQRRITRVVEKSPRRAACMQKAQVEVVHGCHTVEMNANFDVSRVRLLCDPDTHKVCQDAVNG